VIAGGRNAGDGPRDRAAKLKADADGHEEKARRLREAAKWWDIGADGEEIVGAVLDAGLPEADGWHVIHSVVVRKGGGDIDHIVVGPPGVFTLNAKHHVGKTVRVSESEYRVDGGRRDYLDKAISEGTNASSRLSSACSFYVPAYPVLVVVGVAGLRIDAQPRGIHVVDCDGIVEWLRSLPPVLNQHQAASIAERAGNPATWLPPPSPKRSRSEARTPTRSGPARHRANTRRRRAQGESVTAVAVLIVAIVVFVKLSHHPHPAPGTSSETSTTISQTFQTVGTVTNGQCVDAWSDHDVEVLVSGAQAGSDCTRLAAPSYTATLSSGSYPSALSGPYGRSTPGDGVTQICTGSLSDGDHITVYDDGGATFGHAFCMSSGVAT
jgi:nuclease-like protein